MTCALKFKFKLILNSIYTCHKVVCSYIYRKFTKEKLACNMCLYQTHMLYRGPRGDHQSCKTHTQRERETLVGPPLLFTLALYSVNSWNLFPPQQQLFLLFVCSNIHTLRDDDTGILHYQMPWSYISQSSLLHII